MTKIIQFIKPLDRSSIVAEQNYRLAQKCRAELMLMTIGGASTTRWPFIRFLVDQAENNLRRYDLFKSCK